MLELLKMIVDDLEECYQAGTQVNPHAERVKRMRKKLDELHYQMNPPDDITADMNAPGVNNTRAKFHHIKCWPHAFQAAWSGNKTFEIRLNDRGYDVGDIVVLQEWSLDDPKGYTGRTLTVEIKCVWGIGSTILVHEADGYVVFNWHRIIASALHDHRKANGGEHGR